MRDYVSAIDSSIDALIKQANLKNLLLFGISCAGHCFNIEVRKDYPFLDWFEDVNKDYMINKRVLELSHKSTKYSCDLISDLLDTLYKVDDLKPHDFNKTALNLITSTDELQDLIKKAGDGKHTVSRLKELCHL